MCCNDSYLNHLFFQVTQAKLEELRLRHPAVGCAYRLGMYFDTISSLPCGFDALPENDGYSSYFEETDFEEDSLSELMFAKIPGDSASVVDMQVAEQVLLSREKKTQRTCHATYRPSSFIKYQSSGLEDNGLATRIAYNKNSIIYTAASSGYGTALLSPQSSSQPEYGPWNSKESYNSQNSQNSEPPMKQNIAEVGMIKSPAKTSYRSKPLPPTPIELQRSEMEEKPPFSSQKLFDIRRNKPVCSSRNVFHPHGITSSVQTLGSQASIISGDYSRPWDLIRKPNVAKYSSNKCDVSSGRVDTMQKPNSGKVTRSSSNGVPSQLVKPGAKSKREFGKHLEDEAEHIYESITDVDNDYEEVPDDILPSPSIRGLSQTIHTFSNADISPSLVSRSTNVVPLSAISSAGKPVRKDKTTLKKSPKSAAIVTCASHTISTSSNPFGSIKKKGNGKRRATFPDTTFTKCSDKPRGSQPIINYGVV